MEYKYLIPRFKNSPVINGLLDAINDSFSPLDADTTETLDMFDVDRCSGQWLDNLGALIGVRRPAIELIDRYLEGDNLERPADIAVHYVKNAPEQSEKRMTDDEDYRKMIRAQILRNNTVLYSVNTLENIVLKIFFNEAVTRFDVEFNATSGSLTVTVNAGIGYLSLLFLKGYGTDEFGRKRWFFPWPPQVRSVEVIEED